MKMKALIAALSTAMLWGCGLETAGTAATAGNIKAREAAEAKKTQERAQQKIDQAAQQLQQRAQQQGDPAEQK